MERLFQWLDSFKSANMVRAAFGEGRQEAGRTVIPVATVAWGLSDPECREGEAAPGHRQAFGGGALARPMGVISVGSDGVRVHEIVDRTAVTMSGMGLAALVVFFLSRLIGAGLRRRSS